MQCFSRSKDNHLLTFFKIRLFSLECAFKQRRHMVRQKFSHWWITPTQPNSQSNTVQHSSARLDTIRLPTGQESTQLTLCSHGQIERSPWWIIATQHDTTSMTTTTTTTTTTTNATTTTTMTTTTTTTTNVWWLLLADFLFDVQIITLFHE